MRKQQLSTGSSEREQPPPEPAERLGGRREAASNATIGATVLQRAMACALQPERRARRQVHLHERSARRSGIPERERRHADRSRVAEHRHAPTDRQVTYKGMPLYTLPRIQHPGDAKGQGSRRWHVERGDPRGAAAPATSGESKTHHSTRAADATATERARGRARGARPTALAGAIVSRWPTFTSPTPRERGKPTVAG